MKTEAWQFERKIKDRRYVGIAWLPCRDLIVATAALWFLKFMDYDPRPDLPVRKIPACAERETMYLILSPDPLDTTSVLGKGEREMYLRIHCEIAEYIGEWSSELD